MSIADAHQNHIDNGIPTQLDDYSSNATTMATTTDGGESGAESLATSLAGELERLRFAVHEVKKSFQIGVAKWYSTVGNVTEGFVINEAGVDQDFRVESDTLANAFFVDGLNGQVFMNETANSFGDNGLTINQGGFNTEILTLRSTDVAHGMTTDTATNSYGVFRKVSNTDGGLLINGYSDVTTGLMLRGSHITDDATRSVAGRGAIRISGGLKSGTAATVQGANTNILSVESFTTTRFILDSDGDSHQDVGTAWTNFDEHDDVILLTALSAGVARPGDPIREMFGGFLADHRETLERVGLVAFNEDGHHFVNMSKLAMLNTGAIRQLAGRLDRMERLLPPPA